MSKLLFGHSVDQGSGGSGGGDSTKPGGWDPVFTQEDDGKAPSLSPINPSKSDAITLKPAKPKPKKTRTPEGLHRDVIDENLGTGSPAQVAVGMGEQSESDHEYKYAPGLTPMARLIFNGEVAETYQERQSNVAPQDPPGYPDRIEDSNNTPARPGRRGDKNVQLDRLPGDKSYPSGSPEPPDGADIGVGNMVYPLDGILFIKGGEFKEVVEDPENFLRHTYIWTSEPNRLPSSVLVQVADLNEPGTTEEQPSMTLVIGPDGQWTMDKDASGNWVPRPPTHEHPEADFPEERMPVAYESAVQHLPKVLKDVSAKVMKKLGQQQTGEEKDDAPKGKSYNVLEDPALELAPGITPEEKIFTTIQEWDGDTFYADPAKLDKATMAILQQNPKSNQRKHKYFRWDYISKADLEKGAAKDIEKLGYTVGNEPALIVERLPAWKKVEDQVNQARKEKSAS